MSINTDEFRIDKAGENDAGIIAKFGEKAFNDAFGHLNPPDDHAIYVKKAFSIDNIRHELKEETNYFYLAHHFDTVFGYIKVKTGAFPTELKAVSPLELERIYVDKSLHGKGVGKRLMETCVLHALTHGNDAVWLGTWDINFKAIRFYESHGFKTIGNRIFVVGNDRQNDVIMAKYLS